MEKTFLKFALGAFLIAACASTQAKDLFVNGTTGNDSVSYAANNESAPWRTIGRAAWGSTSRGSPNTGEAARAGDVVRVAAGTYTTTGTGERYGVAYNPVNNGTRTAPITFAAQGLVTLTYSGGAGPVIGSYGVDYITWRGFTINEANALSVSDTGPVVVGDCEGAVIEDNNITGLGNNGRQDNYVGVRIDGCTDVTVRNNRIRNFLGFGRNSSGIMTYYSGRLLFERNEISNTGSGIYLKANITNTDWITIRYNLIYSIETGGIDIHRTPTTASGPVLIYQNVIRDSSSGVKFHAFDGGSTDPANVKVVNNTLINNARQLHILYEMRANANHIFWNNVISGGTYGVYMEAPAANLTPARIDIEHNVYNTSTLAEVSTVNYTLPSWKSTFQMDMAAPAGVSTNPMFVDASGDFKLQANSPARTVGVDVLDLDRDGSTTDIIPAGAYITGTEVVGRGSIPSAPTQLLAQ